MAILPVQGDFAPLADSLFHEIFGSDSGIAWVPIPEIRESIQSDNAFVDIINRRILVEYEKSAFKAGPNLKSSMNEAELAIVREALKQPDFLLVPVKYGVGSAGLGMVTATAFVLRLYDLRSGDLVFQKEENANISLSGEIGRRVMTVSMVSMMHEAFRKNFLEQYVWVKK